MENEPVRDISSIVTDYSYVVNSGVPGVTAVQVVKSSDVAKLIADWCDLMASYYPSTVFLPHSTTRDGIAGETLRLWLTAQAKALRAREE